MQTYSKGSTISSSNSYGVPLSVAAAMAAAVVASAMTAPPVAMATAVVAAAVATHRDEYVYRQVHTREICTQVGMCTSGYTQWMQVGMHNTYRVPHR